MEHWAACAFFIVAFLLGGSSRDDSGTQMLVQLAAISTLVAIYLSSRAQSFAPVRLPLILLGGWAALILLTLIPLPPAIWGKLPGRAPFLDAATLAGEGGAWRPAALLPDLAIGALLGLLPPLAALVAAVAAARNWRILLAIALGAAMLSAFAGLAQIAQIPGTRFYEISDLGVPSGLFPNRNHQAVLLALIPAALVALAASWPAEARARRLPLFSAALAPVFVMPMIVATGSRSGLAIGALTLIVCAFWAVELLPQSVVRFFDNNSRARVGLLVGLGGGVLAALVAIVAMSRNSSVQRLTGASLEDELRLVMLRPMLEIAKRYFPLGTGGGSFAPVFQVHEPDSVLATSYFNNAHNEALQMAIEYGLPGVLIGLVVVAFWTRATVLIWFDRSTDAPDLAFARFGSIASGAMLLASLTDYPLRTPALATLFALSIVFMIDLPHRRHRIAHCEG